MLKSKHTFTIIVGKNISRIRKEQKLTQVQLAFEAGVTREFINKIESGKNNVSLKNLILIAEVLSIHPKKLFE